METLLQVLMRRDQMSEEEAMDLIQDAKEDLQERLESNEFIDDADFMKEWFGLEPDYFLEMF